ncbi:rRNA pseudouridine synthase [Aureimonas fodinaquatilis]|uniref:Pseudouridine synthase n=1 Tax=Aureimonas fodinaquatilis TaxID=2565783 RepID=A0A5B0E264_9HYPH|nr:pseudouridine synthase [Aureimonas fodinaquatilis]KAA0972051.1 rRNA pseudouridine synthase [Aureimonas fodinaquatilis]
MKQARQEPLFGLTRIFSKLGIASRTQAEAMVRAGRVAVDGVVVSDPDKRLPVAPDRITLDGEVIVAAEKFHLMVNKPRGLVTTLSDPEGRDTIYRCIEGLSLPHVSPVGRLDKASEGLIFMTNDTLWAQRLLDPESGPDKIYHVQVDCVADEAVAARLRKGVMHDGEIMRAKAVRILRQGQRNSWLEVVLDEGRNRQIRRLLAAQDIGVLRLVRTAIGPVSLGDLAKGAVRPLTAAELSDIERSFRADHPKA